jgi:hypothetical protein
MVSRLWLAALWIGPVLLLPVALSAQINRVAESKRSTKCSKNGDSRYMVCRGAWSGKTVALFNTWMAPDTNPERRFDLPSRLTRVRRIAAGGIVLRCVTFEWNRTKALVGQRVA